jgi:hypothetical protein
MSMSQCVAAIGWRPISAYRLWRKIYMEYRIEMIHFDNIDNRLEHVLRRLNAFGKEGWRVVSVDLRAHPAFTAGPLPVLLERPTASGAATRNVA